MKKKLTPLEIPGDINLYDELVAMAGKNPDVAALVDCLHRTMQHFEIPRERWREVGNVVQRFSMLLCLQDEQVSVDTDDPGVHALIDLTEHYNKLAGKELEGKEVDPFPSWPRRFSK